MANYFSGQHGKLYIDGTKAAAVTDWSINSSMSPLATTTLEETDQTFIDGLRTTTGSCSLLYYQDGNNNSARDLVEKLMKERTTGSVPGVAEAANNVRMTLYINDGTTAGKSVTVDALITSAAMQMAVGEVLAAQVNFQVNGAPMSVDL
jgi:hypothetical protein